MTQDCNPVIPEHRLILYTTHIVIQKMDIVSRRQWLILNHPDDAPETFSTEKSLAEALDLVEAVLSRHTDELLWPFRWAMKAYPQYHMMLYVLCHLCIHPSGPSVDRAWRAVEGMFKEIEPTDRGTGPGSKWTVLVALKAKAKRLRQSACRPENPGAIGPDLTSAGHSNGTEEADTAETCDELNEEQFDWGTLINDFQMDTHDFSVLF